MGSEGGIGVGPGGDARRRVRAARGVSSGHPLLKSCSRFRLAVGKMKVGDAISRNADCSAYAGAAEMLGRIYTIASACVRHLYFGEDYGVSVRAQGAKGPLPDFSVVEMARWILASILSDSWGKLDHCYRIEGRDNRMSHNVALVLFTLDAVQFKMLPNDKRENCSSFAAENDEWLCDNNVAIVSGSASIDGGMVPVLSYRMSQLQTAIFQLCSVWNDLCFSRELVRYVELIRVHVGRFLNMSYSSRMHDVKDLRSGVEFDWNNPDGNYQCSNEFLLTMCPVVEMVSRIVRYESLSKASAEEVSSAVGEVPNWKFLLGSLGAWLKNKIEASIPDGSSEYMADPSIGLLEQNLRPGERAVYEVKAGGSKLSDVRFILDTNRKQEYDWLARLKDKTYAQVIEEELPDALALGTGVGGKESKQLVLCVIELIEITAKASFFQKIDIRDFIVMERQISDSRQTDLVYVEEPLIVQLFNHFQVYYKGKLYVMNSFVLSFILWFKLIERDKNCVVRGCDLSAWRNEILVATLGNEDLPGPEHRSFRLRSDSGFDDDAPRGASGADDGADALGSSAVMKSTL